VRNAELDMTTTSAPVDPDVLHGEIRRTYTDVSVDQQREYIFPTGRAWARELG
jgi:arsenite methyltransferase